MRWLLLLLFLPLCATQRIYLGPEGYHLKRTRAGGSCQAGSLYGAKAGYERIKCFGFYWAADGQYAKGRITGHDARDKRIESRNTEGEIEGRLGFTLKWHATFTPFAAYGYFRELNDFSPPSPIAVCFRNSFKYTALGLLASIELPPAIQIGLLGKVAYMINGKCRVDEDPIYDDATIPMTNEVHYRVELPIGYAFCNQRHRFRASAVPFWWYRHYGGREAVPFDFVDTKIQIWGLQLLLSCYF